VTKLHHIEFTFHVLIFIVSQHVKLGLYFLLTLEHSDFIISVDKVIEVDGTIGLDLVLRIFLLIFLGVGFLRHGFPFSLLIFI